MSVRPDLNFPVMRRSYQACRRGSRDDSRILYAAEPAKRLARVDQTPRALGYIFFARWFPDIT